MTVIFSVVSAKLILWVVGAVNLAALSIDTHMVSLAALFTDTQWASIQSFLNFVVLIVLYAKQDRNPKETVEVMKDSLDPHKATDPQTELRGLFAETILDAMEKRRKGEVRP